MVDDPHPAQEWLVAGGQFGAAVRAVDWSTSPLGARERWPTSLRTALALVADSSAPMALVWGPDKLLFANDALAEATGTGPRVPGRPAREACPAFDAMLDAADPADSRGFEDAPFELGGQTIYFSGSTIPVRREDGRVGGTLLILRETTAAHEQDRQLRDNEARFRSLFESIDEGFCIVEVLFEGERPVDLRYLLVNPAFAQQARARDVVGRRMGELYPDFDPGWLELYGRVAQTGSSVRVQREAPLLGRHFDVFAFRVGDPSRRQVGILFKDITARQRAEAALREAEEKRRAAEHLNAALTQADREKTEFLARLSHELRNPLAPIMLALELLDQAPAVAGPARRAQQVISRQAKLLASLVDELLEVTRISRGKIDLRRERLDLRELVARTLDDHRGLFERAGVTLAPARAGAPVFVDADPNRMVQVLDNLLQNAAKFTARGGQVRVELGLDGERALVEISDDGVGIDPAMLARVFEPFLQTDQQPAEQQGGLGLGLAVVKGLVELHGGTVSAHSDGPGRGATFAIRLPHAL